MFGSSVSRQAHFLTQNYSMPKALTIRIQTFSPLLLKSQLHSMWSESHTIEFEVGIHKKSHNKRSGPSSTHCQIYHLKTKWWKQFNVF